MKITGVLRNCARKVVNFLNVQREYPKYKYSASVQIASDMNKVLKNLNKTAKTVGTKSVQKVH